MLIKRVINTLAIRDNREKKPSSDESLAFDAAVAALGLKANVSEADHPLLCEGTRRQRLVRCRVDLPQLIPEDTRETIIRRALALYGYPKEMDW